MSRFNMKVKSHRTTNLAGGEAFQESPEMEFISILLTSFVQDQFYRSADTGMERVRELIQQLPDKTLAAKAAIYARHEFGMRSISHVVAGEIGKQIKGKQWTRLFFRKIIRRVDDITEILAYYLSQYGKPLPNAMKRGLADAFGKFDAYQLAKYRAEKAEVSLVDAVNLIHPTPTEKNAEALRQLIEGTLRSRGTWESKLTDAGQKKDVKQAKAGAWRELIHERKIGYFALLRNLRNILEQAPDIIEETMQLLTDEHFIRKSLVLPFRYTTALEAIQQTGFEHVQNVIVGLNQAVDISIQNVPELSGKTIVLLDESGSMRGRPIEIGSLFASILIKSNQADLIMFSNDARYKAVNSTDSTLSIQREITRGLRMRGTNFIAPFKTMQKAYDRIIILSDMQGWMQTGYGYGYGNTNLPTKIFAQYKQQYQCNPVVYSFDLQGYGTLQVPEPNVYCLAGFSEKVFNIMKLLEQDRKALLHTICAVEL